MKCKRCGWKTCACDMRIKTVDEIARMETPQTGGNRMTTKTIDDAEELELEIEQELAALRTQVETLTAERDEAVEAEREEIAKACDALGATLIADAIRARGKL